MPFRPIKPLAPSVNTVAQGQNVNSSYQKNISNPLGEVATGFVKGGLSTGLGLGTIGSRFAAQTVGRITNLIKGKGFVPDYSYGADIYKPETEQGQQAQQFVTPTNTAQTLGFGAEKIAEFFIPASQAAKTERTINLISQGMRSPLLAATYRIGAKAATQAVSGGLVTAAQTGGNMKEVAKTAAVAGGIRGGMAIIGEGARALHLPERLYSTIFKNSRQDMINELKSNGLRNLQATDPNKFNEFVSKGIIKVGKNGEAILNDTLAEQALDKGLRGSIRNMANEVVEGTLDSENKVLNIAKKYSSNGSQAMENFGRHLTSAKQVLADTDAATLTKLGGMKELLAQLKTNTAMSLSHDGFPEIAKIVDAIDDKAFNSIDDFASAVSEKIASAGKVTLTEPQFKNVLNRVVSDYADVGFGEISDEARVLVQKLNAGAGKLSAEDALLARRLLDRIRIAASFEKPITNLSQSQANLKTLADTIRGRVNAIPGMGQAMKDYSFYLDALEALAKEAARRGNNQVLSLIDSLFLSGAYAGNNPVPGVTMGMLRKILMSASGTTALGQLLKNSTISPPLYGAVSAGSSAIPLRQTVPTIQESPKLQFHR